MLLRWCAALAVLGGEPPDSLDMPDNADQPEFVLPRSLSIRPPGIGLVLGSGLGGFVDRIEVVESVCFSEIEGLPVSRVPGHAGRFCFGSIGGESVVIAQGRAHLYEGWTAREVAAQIRFFRELGVETVVLTNAAGIVNPGFHPGHWMILTDHLNLARQSPLTGGAHFVDQSGVYDSALRDLLQDRAEAMGAPRLFEGVYAWLNGPEYETPAEIRMLRHLGADAVGMSTVPEAIQARALGLRVVALSCLTNYGAGMSQEPLDHREVVEVGRQAAVHLVELLETCIPRMREPAGS